MRSDLVKPEIAAVYEFLHRHGALIVHFSGTPPMWAKDHGESNLFPNYLLHVVAGKAKGGVCCSVVCPGDIFEGPNANAIGCIGVVLGLNSAHSLATVRTDDDGSLLDEDDNRVILKEVDILLEDLDRSLSQRKGHNEWVIRDYVVLGIFAAHPYKLIRCGIV